MGGVRTGSSTVVQYPNFPLNPTGSGRLGGVFKPAEIECEYGSSKAGSSTGSFGPHRFLNTPRGRAVVLVADFAASEQGIHGVFKVRLLNPRLALSLANTLGA